MQHPGPPVVPVGRRRQVTELERFVSTALDGHPDLVWVNGPANVGCTALIDYVVATLAQRRDAPQVVRVAGLPWERDDEGEMAIRLLSRGRPAGPIPDERTRTALTAAYLDWWRAASSSSAGLVVVVDDAQHADGVSLRALSSAVQRLGDERVIVVLAVTVADIADPRLAQVLRAHRHHVVLRGLDATEVQELAQRRGIGLSLPAAGRLAAVTDGLPGLVVELLTDHPDFNWAGSDLPPAPRSARTWLEDLLARGGPEVRRLAAAVAVAGDQADLLLIGRLAGLADPTGTLDSARNLGLLDVHADRGRQQARFTNRVLQAAAYDTLDLGERHRLHLAAAAQATAGFQRLRHRALAAQGPDADLAAELVEAARSSARDGRWSASAEAWVMAARTEPEPERAQDLLIRALDALCGAGRLHDAVRLAGEVEALPAGVRRNAALAYLATMRGQRARTAHLLQEAERLGDEGSGEGATDPKGVAVTNLRLALHALADFDADEMRHRIDRVEEMGEHAAVVGHPAVVEARALRGLAVGAAGRRAEGRELYLRLLTQLSEGAQMQRVRMGRGWLEVADDRLDQAVEDLSAAVPRAYWQGSARVSLWALGWLARARTELGQWDLALEAVDRGAALVDQSGIELIAPLIHGVAVEITAWRGDEARAEEHLARAQAMPSEYFITRLPIAMARARLAEARSDNDGVLHALEPIATGTRAHRADEPGFWPWHATWANALIRDGNVEAARSFLAEHTARAEAAGHASARARLAMAGGGLAGAEGDLEGARTQYETALQLIAELPLAFLRTRIHYAYGQTLRRAGKRREADQLLRRATDGFEALGAAAYVERCRRELRAGGVAGSRTGSVDLTVLTPQERAVARLVARGQRNAEVARELFISVKTVQFHLTRVYAKLGVQSRTALAAERSAFEDDPDQ